MDKSSQKSRSAANQRSWWVFLPVVGCALFILILSILPGEQLPKIDWDLLAPDKWAHAIAYFTLAVCWQWGFAQRKVLDIKHLFLAIIGASGFGFLIELLQYSLFPYRFFEVLDIIANISGALASSMVFPLLRSKN